MMPCLRRLAPLAALLLAPFLLAAFGAAAETWPAHPIKMIIPFPPGGSNDIVGRMVAAQLGERLGQSIVVDNRGGAGGTIGTGIAAKAPPDGYTILLVSVAYAFNPALYKGDFSPGPGRAANSPNRTARS